MHSVAEMGDGQPMSRRTSSYYNYEELQKEAEEMRDVERAEDEVKQNLMFEEKDVSLIQIYCHLAEPIDYFYIVLATIGSIAAGLSMPIMSYLSTDLFSDVGNTSEYANDPEKLLQRVKHAFDVCSSCRPRRPCGRTGSARCCASSPRTRGPISGRNW